MYLPLHFLQFPFSPGHKNLATLSPYHDAPNVPGVSVNLPHDCTVDQVIVVSSLSHSEPVLRMTLLSIRVTPTRIAWSRVRATVHSRTRRIPRRCTRYNSFHSSSTQPALPQRRLRVPARPSGADHRRPSRTVRPWGGVRVSLSKNEIASLTCIVTRFALRYPKISTDVVISSPVPRVVDSSCFFAKGFFGLKTENVTFRTVTDLDDPVSWITPWKSCPKFTEYQAHQVKFVARIELLCPQQHICRRFPNGRLNTCFP